MFKEAKEPLVVHFYFRCMQINNSGDVNNKRVLDVEFWLSTDHQAQFNIFDIPTSASSELLTTVCRTK